MSFYTYESGLGIAKRLGNNDRFYPRAIVGDLLYSSGSSSDFLGTPCVDYLDLTPFVAYHSALDEDVEENQPQPQTDQHQLHRQTNRALLSPVTGGLRNPYDRYDELVFESLTHHNAKNHFMISDSLPSIAGSYVTHGGVRSLQGTSYASGGGLTAPQSMISSRLSAGATTSGIFGGGGALAGVGDTVHGGLTGGDTRGNGSGGNWSQEFDTGLDDMLSRSLGTVYRYMDKTMESRGSLGRRAGNELAEGDGLGFMKDEFKGNGIGHDPILIRGSQNSPRRQAGLGLITGIADLTRSESEATSTSESFKGTDPSPGTGGEFHLSRFSKSSPGKQQQAFSKWNPFRQNYINPCNPSKNLIRTSSHVRRWQHVVPNSTISPSEYVPVMKWRSLTTPACLPLTTDFFPTVTELAQLYEETTYTVTPDDDALPYQFDQMHELQMLEALRIELVSQRLSQGFQLVLSNTVEKTLLGTVPEESTLSMPGIGGAASSKFWGGGKTVARATAAPFYVSLGDHVHRIFFDQSGKNVEVKQYIRKVSYNTSPFKYKCAIWPKLLSGYTTASFVFAYPSLAVYKWNHHDHYISGFQDEMVDSMRYWRTRFLLVPMESLPQTSNLLNPFNENLDEEELRLAGFKKVIEMFEKSRWLQPHEKGSDRLRTGSGLNVQFTTQLCSAYVKEEWGKSTFVAGRSVSSMQTSREDFGKITNNSFPALFKSSTLSSLTNAMQDLISGCPIKDRRWHFRLYENVFIGSECVDWMMRTLRDVNTREDATEFGNELLERGVFEHANRKHRFLDGHYFYRLNREYVVTPLERDLSGSAGTATPSWFSRASTGISKSNIDMDDVQPIAQPIASGSFAWRQQQHNHHINQQQALPKLTGRPVELSRRIDIDMDPLKKSSRKETALLHYNTIHNPKNSYHFQLHWLTCSSRLVEDLLQSWARIAEKCGLKFVEAPVEQSEPFSNDRPFQSVIDIPFATPPPQLSLVQERSPTIDLHPEWAELELAKRFGFVMDVEADYLFPPDSIRHSYSATKCHRTQLVHRTGLAFLQIEKEGKGFRWVQNRLYLSGSSARLVAVNTGVNGSGSGIGSVGVSGGSSATSGAGFNEVRAQLRQLCASSEELGRLWDEMVAIRTQLTGTVEVATVSEPAENAVRSKEATASL